MGKIITILLIALLLSSCAHKILGKNCEKTESGSYFVCDSLSISGN